MEERVAGGRERRIFEVVRFAAQRVGRDLRARRGHRVESSWRRAGTARPSAPVKAPIQRGGSPRQAVHSPACDRRLLRRGNTGWGAAGGEPAVRNDAKLRVTRSEPDSATSYGEPARAERSPGHDLRGRYPRLLPASLGAAGSPDRRSPADENVDGGSNARTGTAGWLGTERWEAWVR